MRHALLLVLLLAGCATGAGVEGTSPSTTVTTTTTIAPTTTGATTSTTEARPEACDRIVEEPTVVGTIREPAVFEASGIVRSESLPGVLWVHNDSGSPPRLWAIGEGGEVLGHHEVRARNVDWEDVALGPGPDGTLWVYLADIGDNLGRRAQVWLHRFPEPTETSGVIEDVESLMVTYPAGAADAEALLVDPQTGDAFIVTKTPSGRSTILRVPVGAWAQDATSATQVGSVDLGALAFVTAGDISPDGSVIALRTYGDVWLWEREPGETVAEALAGRRCRAPAPAEPQGEAIALDTTGYTTISEGVEPVLYRFDGLDG